MALASDIQQQVYDLLSRASNLAFVTADQEAGGVSALTPGQRVSAEVVAIQANNRVQVRVGNERFNLDLPHAVRTGQMLEMTYVSGMPRSTFAIARQTGDVPPVSLSDASRLLSLLVASEQLSDPQLRSSLQSIGGMIRQSSGESTVLANLLDETLIYDAKRGLKNSTLSIGDTALSGGGRPGADSLSSDQTRLAAFETSATQLLKNIAQNSRATLVEAASHPLTPLPLTPGEEVNATVVGTLPGGRAFVQVAGTTLELTLPQKVVPGDIVRLTYLLPEPKPTFALLRAVPDATPPLLSEAGRWLSVLEHSEGGVSDQQTYVLERLNTVLKSLPPDSPAFSVISDEALTYERNVKQQSVQDQSGGAASKEAPQPLALSGNGIVLSNDMAKLLQAVIKGSHLALLEAQNQAVSPGSFMPGQQVRGDVVAALGGGRFTVQVAGQLLEFIMPKGVRRGDRVNLFFITAEPCQTFLMVRFGGSGDSRVSETGRWLSNFLGQASGQAPAQATLGILQTLLSGPATDAVLLGQKLQQGLRESGMFYESHLSRWFEGDYPLEEILREPQGKLSSRLAHTELTPGVTSSADELVRANVRNTSTEVMEAVFKSAGVVMANEGIADQRTLPMVGEQLSVLQSGQMVFRGDIFPGQHLEWSVAERDAQQNRSGNRNRSWETSVTINFPQLGAVTAQLVVDGTNVVVNARAENSMTLPLLEAGRVALAEQLAGAGLSLTEMSVDHVAAR